MVSLQELLCLKREAIYTASTQVTSGEWKVDAQYEIRSESVKFKKYEVLNATNGTDDDDINDIIEKNKY